MEYEKEIQKTQELIKFNLSRALKMDEILGKSEDIDDHVNASDIFFIREPPSFRVSHSSVQK